MPTDITLKTLTIFCAVISSLVSLITFVVSRTLFACNMEKKFRLKTDSENCIKEREMAEGKILQVLSDIDGKLGTIDKRLAVGNIIQRKLVEANKDIPNDEIDKIERDVGLKQ